MENTALSMDHVRSVCLIGQGELCCSFLVMRGDFTCAKGTELEGTLKARRSGMNAKGDNCSGPPDFAEPVPSGFSVGAEIRWATPEECPGNERFVEANCKKYPGVLLVEKHDDKVPPNHPYGFNLIVSHEGEIIDTTPDLDLSPTAFNPYWFRPCS